MLAYLNSTTSNCMKIIITKNRRLFKLSGLFICLFCMGLYAILINICQCENIINIYSKSIKSYLFNIILPNVVIFNHKMLIKTPKPRHNHLIMHKLN